MRRPLLALALAGLMGCGDAAQNTGRPGGDGAGVDAGRDGFVEGPDASDGADTGEPDQGDVPEPACVETDSWFEERAWAPLMRDQCALCHTNGGPAGHTRMVLVGPDSGGDWIAQNLSGIRAVSLDEVEGLPTLLARPSGQHPDGHGGGNLIAEGSPAYDALARLAARLRGELDECGRGDLPIWGTGNCDDAPRVGGRVLRRLTHPEYAATLRDLVGAEVDTERLAPDDTGLRGVGSEIEIVGLLADQYREVAEEISQRMNLVPWLSCGLTEGSSACAADFIQTFGARAFRRPLSRSEIRDYLDFYVEIAVEDGFSEGLRWTVAAMLQSPSFLYRAELGRRGEGGRFDLTSYEIAAELSYSIWGTLPDDELWEAARTGALYDVQVIEAQAQRLLTDERATRRAQTFVELWMGLDQLDTVFRDADIYPELTREMRDDMLSETRRFVGAVWEDGGSLGDLLTRRTGTINAALADYYGVPAPSTVDEDGFGEVDLSASAYGGLLTHGSVLTTHALPTNSSPIHRGLLVREELLCQTLPPPPSNLDTSPPPVDPALSTRERYAQHTADPACFGCHDLIDDIGFGFEHFDGIGRYREFDGVHPVNAQGEILHSDGADAVFNGVLELAAELAQADAVAMCYVDKWAQFTLGVDTEQGAGACRVEAARARFLDGDRDLDDALVALVATEHFRWRLGEEGELDAPGADVLPLPGEGPFEAVPFDAGEEPNLPDLDSPREVSFTVDINSAWDAGYCADVTVLNIVDTDVQWSILVEIEGTITSAWNVMRSGDSGNVVFSGVDWNGIIGPGQTAQFGFCASR